MLTFAAPLGLLALGALAVPLALHLVRRPPRTVRLGNLRFLDAAPRRIRSLRWRDRLLLALRCLLLAVLAALLATPLWQPRHPARVRWALQLPDAKLPADARAEWDRLLAAGFAPRLLAPGFPSATATPSASTSPQDAWSLLRELDDRLPAGSEAVVFGSLHAGQFRGPRPVLHRVSVRWHETDTTLAPPAPAAPPRFALVAAPDRAEDAAYLRAALAALGAVEGDAPAWIFQLGDAPLPTALPAARVVSDAPATAPVASVARTLDVAGTSVRLHQRTPAPAGAPLLRDSAGEPLLVAAPDGNWRFALRFHPAWTDWPHTSAFPAWWREHLAPPPPAGRLAAAQAAPAISPTTTPPPLAAAPIDLRPFCWLVALALFVAERWLSRRTPPPSP